MAARFEMFDARADERFERHRFARLTGLIPPPVLARRRAFFDPPLVADRVPNKAVVHSRHGRVVTNRRNILAPARGELLPRPHTDAADGPSLDELSNPTSS